MHHDHDHDHQHPPTARAHCAAPQVPILELSDAAKKEVANALSFASAFHESPAEPPAAAPAAGEPESVTWVTWVAEAAPWQDALASRLQPAHCVVARLVPL